MATAWYTLDLLMDYFVPVTGDRTHTYLLRWHGAVADDDGTAGICGGGGRVQRGPPLRMLAIRLAKCDASE